MTKPQQPELARDRRGSQDQDGKAIRRPGGPDTSEAQESDAPVPPENQPGHSPPTDQDKPDVPPHERDQE